MTGEKILNTAKKKKISLFLGGLLFAAISFVFLVYTQENFKASSDVLITQNQTGYADYYTLSKSADYLSGIITEAVYSEKFLDEAIATKLMNPEFLPQDKIERLKVWSDTVRINKKADVGIIHLETFADTQKQATDISNAVLAIMTEKTSLFLGQGQNVDAKILSGPIWEKNPSVSDIASASAGGFIVGLLIVFIWMFYAEESAAIKMQERTYGPEKNEYQESLDHLEI